VIKIFGISNLQVMFFHKKGFDLVSSDICQIFCFHPFDDVVHNHHNELYVPYNIWKESNMFIPHSVKGHGEDKVVNSV
jgi:hypothetical protein